MTTVSPMSREVKDAPKNLVVAYKEIRDGEVSKPSISGGAGDVSLSPSHVLRHTPGASLGAVCGPADAPMAEADFQAPIEVIPGQTRILLSEAASRHLDSAGDECFYIVAKARVPDMVGRWVIHLAPCSMQTARDAEAVLMGRATARRIPLPKPQETPPLTPKQLRSA